MKSLKFFDNIFSCLFFPGILLISKKQFVGYVLYFLFLAVFASPLYSNVLLSFPGMTFYSVALILLYITSIVLNIIKIGVPNNHKLYARYSMVAIVFYLLFGTAIGFSIKYRIEKAKTVNNASDKIAYLEKFAEKGGFESSPPKFIWENIDHLHVRQDLDELVAWKPGVYILVTADTAIIAYQRQDFVYICFDDMNELSNYFSKKHIEIDTTPVFFSFTKEASAASMEQFILALKSLGVSSVKVLYIKYKDNVESRACDPENIKRIKESQGKLIAAGENHAEALAAAVMPLLKSCPSFMIDVDTFFTKKADQRFEGLLIALKKNIDSYGCDIKGMIDFCYFVCLPPTSFSVNTIKLDNLINGKVKLK
jgi:hypothetical protein